jgi:hypothetical protein
MAADQFAQRRFEVPVLEDANSVQMALMQVMQSLAWGQMDHKTAGLMLYALQTASSNLRKTDFEAEEATDVVIDRDTVHLTCLGGQQWFEEDFEEEEEEEEDGSAEDASPRSHGDTEKNEETVNVGSGAGRDDKSRAGEQDGQLVRGVEARTAGDSADGKESEAARPVADRANVKKVNIAEVRENVKGLIRNWVLETAQEKARKDLGG